MTATDFEVMIEDIGPTFPNSIKGVYRGRLKLSPWVVTSYMAPHADRLVIMSNQVGPAKITLWQ